MGGQGEGLARAGDRDVQEAALLLGVEVADGHRLAQELAREEAPVALADRPLALEQVRDEDVVELEALGLVEGHQPDALDVLGELDARRQLAAGGLVGIEVVDEVAQRARRVLALPVGGEAHERRDVGDRSLALQGVRGEQVEEHPGPLDVALEDREGALAGRLGDELVERVEQAAQLGARRRRELEDRSAGGAASGAGPVASAWPSSPSAPSVAVVPVVSVVSAVSVVGTASSVTSPEPTASRISSSRWRFARLAARVIASSSSASSRHGPAVSVRARATSANGSAIARRACSRSRISGVANSESPPDTV